MQRAARIDGVARWQRLGHLRTRASGEEPSSAWPSRLRFRSGRRAEEIDLFVFHQANKFMLEHLRKRLRIPEEKFLIFLSHCGNTVSSTIPIALKESANAGRIKDGDLIALVAFGVGYSWAATLLEWPLLGHS